MEKFINIYPAVFRCYTYSPKRYYCSLMDPRMRQWGVRDMMIAETQVLRPQDKQVVAVSLKLERDRLIPFLSSGYLWQLRPRYALCEIVFHIVDQNFTRTVPLIVHRCIAGIKRYAKVFSLFNLFDTRDLKQSCHDVNIWSPKRSAARTKWGHVWWAWCQH